MGIKNYVEKNQPLLSKTFSLAIKGNRIAHAYLLLGEPGIPLKEIAIFMAKSILCDHGDPLADETCNTCKRIEEGEYPDLIICNGEEASIKKEDVGLVTSSFSKTALEEKGIMIYIIHQVENMTGEACNSILKFLEEPTPNTYAILTSNNEAKILPTIISRCESIRLLLKPREEVEKEAIEDGINEEDAELLSPFYNDASLIKSIVETDDYKNTKQAFNCLVDGLSSSPSFARFAIENQVIPLINTRVNARRLFDFLSLSLEDALSIKNNKTPILKSKIELIKNYDVSISSIEEALTNVLTLRGEIESNINLGLLLTHLISLICKE